MSLDAFPANTNNPESRRVSGSYAPNGSSEVVASTILGRNIKSVTRTSAGLHKVKLHDNYDKLKSWNLNVQLAAATDLKPQLAAVDLQAQGGAELSIRLVAVGTATDMSANAANRVSFDFEFGIGVD